MTKQEQLFEAIGNIGDDIAESAVKNTERRGRRIPLKITIIAAAAVLSMLVGFAAKNDDFRVTFHGNNTHQRGFTTTLTDQQYTIPAELEPLRNEYGSFSCFVDMMPSELYEKFGLTMLTSDNFTETKDVKRKRSINSGKKHTWEPRINGDELCVDLEYCLYDKNIGINVWFKGTYIADNERYIMQGSSFGLADLNSDIVPLRDGSLAMICDRSAAFCLDGVYYTLNFDDYMNGSVATIDNMKQILADLEILATAE